MSNSKNDDSMRDMSNAELLNTLDWVIAAFKFSNSESFKKTAEENYELIKAELLKRLS